MEPNRKLGSIAHVIAQKQSQRSPITHTAGRIRKRERVLQDKRSLGKQGRHVHADKQVVDCPAKEGRSIDLALLFGEHAAKCTRVFHTYMRGIVCGGLSLIQSFTLA